MTRPSHFLIVALFVALGVQFAHSQTPPIFFGDCLAQYMTGFNSSDFYAEPQDVPLSYCEESNGNSCCVREYSEEIGAFADPFSLSFLEIIRDPFGECRETLEDISCLMCSSAQVDWIYLSEDFSSLVMCQSFCDELFDSCSDQLNIQGTHIFDAYDDSTEFCHALFDQISNSETPVKVLLDTHNRDCWSDLPECTPDSYYKLYTECEDDRRNMIWVKKPEVECAGGFDNPQNEADLPCALACEAGERTGTNGCEACEEGTFSRGSDIIEDSWSTPDDLVLHFNSYCTWTDGYGVERLFTEQPCAWSLHFGAMSSPAALNDSMSAYLETSFTLLEAGIFSFSATVDSELNFDGLNILVDRVQSNEVPFISHTNEFSEYVVHLTAGYHFIQLVYSKDVSVSYGLDQAVLNMIKVTNVRYASDFCTPCAPGKYNDQPHMKECTLCPLNTFSNSPGAIECTPCPDGEYAYEGATECTPKPDCDSDSTYNRYGECFFDEDSQSPKRLLTAHWVEPHICNSDELPEEQLVDCAPCEPGMYRDEGGIDCYFCAGGLYSEGDDSPCMPCEAGSEANRHLVFDEFNSFAYGLSTRCDYDCNTPGWVMREDMIDSGTGHGTYVISTLLFNQTFPQQGRLTFEFSLFCTEACLLTFESDTSSPLRYFGGSGVFFNPSNVVVSVPVEAGTHSFRWVFTRDDRDGTGRNDRAQINKIDASNVAEGGAIDCTPCNAGFYNPYQNQAECTPASPGFYSPGASVEQIQCPAATFTDTEGSSECMACGENVQANEDNTACDVTCQLQSGNFFYDLSAMNRNDTEMYGPVWDRTNHTYYLNMCDEQHNGHTCFSVEGEPLETYACQVSDIGIGQDLGSTFGMLPLRDIHPLYTLGVTVHLSNGALCHNGSHYFPRETYIDVLCDPSAGVGTPVPLYADVETQKCLYQFVWYSQFACPLCQESDYHFTVSPCIDDMETLTYEWNSNPRMCHDGVALPEPQEIPCADAVYCGPGQYYSAGTSNCEDAPRGFYSVGNGFKVTTWTELENGFSSNGWIQSENYIASGDGDTTLIFVHNFVREGSVEFTYAVNNYGDSTAGFTVYIDDVMQGEEIYSTNSEYVTRTVTVPSGYHYIKFAFEGGTLTTTNTRARGARIKEMTILGVNWAASSPVPCPAGTYSDETGATTCTTCGWNTYSFEASRHCIGCSPSDYAFPGSSSCVPKEPCTVSDYTLTYSECTDGAQSAEYVLVEPVICQEDVPPTPEEDTIDCFPCEKGSYRDPDSDACKTCSVGKYYDEEQGKCKSAKAGSAGILYQSYFVSPMPGNTLPEEFTTGCNGNCFCADSNSHCDTNGWRFRGSYLDSGLNENREVDSYIELVLDVTNDGSISFDYEVLGQSSNGLEFFINEKQLDLPYHPSGHSKKISQAVFDVEQGINQFRWNYHQDADTVGSVQLSSIIIEGIGGATESVTCGPGTFSEVNGASVCSLCPPGTATDKTGETGCNVCGENSYTPKEGASECIECGSGTKANSDRTDCETDCKFVFDDSLYDLSSLQSTHGPFPIDDDGSSGIWMNICEKRKSSSFCLDPYGESISTYMCEVDTRGNGIDYGNHLSVDLVEVEGSPEKAVRLSYTVEGDDDDASCKSTVTVVCDPDASVQIPFIIGNPTDCDLHMRWNSDHGCRVCDEEEDYDVQESECDDGERTFTTVRKANCFGPAILKIETESCPTRYSFPLAVIIVVAILVLVLMVIIVGAVVYNRRLHGQYTALVRDSEGQYEMENIDEDTTVSDDKEKSEAV